MDAAPAEETEDVTAQEGADQTAYGTEVRDDAEASPETEAAVAGGEGEGKLCVDREASVCGGRRKIKGGKMDVSMSHIFNSSSLFIIYVRGSGREIRGRESHYCATFASLDGTEDTVPPAFRFFHGID